jgi:hypothetical protein
MGGYLHDLSTVTPAQSDRQVSVRGVRCCVLVIITRVCV